MTRTIRIAFLGFGTVNRALQELIVHRARALDEQYGIVCETVGVATRSGGWRSGDRDCGDLHGWLVATRPEVVFEGIALDPHAGQPAVDYLRAVLTFGAHVISANKGPVVYAARELRAMADEKRVAYRFEAAVMDGAPVFSLVRECLPLAGLRGIRGVFTSTATIVLETIERGASIDDGIAEAHRLGIAEADPSFDIDGWDSAVKLCALANVLLNADLKPDAVHRTGIRALPVEEIRRAHREGTPLRLIGETDGLAASVRLVPCPFGPISGTTLVTHFDADVFPGGLTITSHQPDPTTTAYGMFTDFLSVVSAHRYHSRNTRESQATGVVR
jgi:homoserine dehydrogenase